MNQIEKNKKASKVKKASTNPSAATQSHIRIAEIQSDTTILKNGAVRAVLEVSSVNFSLKSEQEQESIIASYQSFLNTLEFPVQIIIQSKKIDLDHYRQTLEGEVYKSSMIMRRIFEVARQSNRRIVFAEGEDDRVLRAAQAMVEDGVDTPILVGRPDVISQRLERAGLSIKAAQDFDIVNPESDDRYRDYWQSYYDVMKRKGVTPDLAKAVMRTNTTAIAATMVHLGDADSLICGTFGQYHWHLNYVTQMLQTDKLSPIGALSLVILDAGPLFVTDTHVNIEQTPETLARTVIASARHVRRFGLEPRIALCSGSQFGNLDSPSGRVTRGGLAILDQEPRGFEYEGEMHTDAALNPELRERLMPDNRLTGRANVLVYSNTDAAGAARNLLKSAAGGLEVGPILMGMGNRAHIVTPGVTPRGLLNIAGLAGSDVASYG